MELLGTAIIIVVDAQVAVSPWEDTLLLVGNSMLA
jgi:hypothetical protein